MSSRPTPEPLAALRRELGAEVPPAIAALPEDQIRTLLHMLEDARGRQTAALDAAVDRGLAFIPRPARAAVKRVLF